MRGTRIPIDPRISAVPMNLSLPVGMSAAQLSTFRAVVVMKTFMMPPPPKSPARSPCAIHSDTSTLTLRAVNAMIPTYDV